MNHSVNAVVVEILSNQGAFLLGSIDGSIEETVNKIVQMSNQ